jgi:hypothetical protein
MVAEDLGKKGLAFALPPTNWRFEMLSIAVGSLVGVTMAAGFFFLLLGFGSVENQDETEMAERKRKASAVEAKKK